MPVAPARAGVSADGESRGSLPILGNCTNFPGMTTMNISLPESLKDFVDEQVATRGYGTSSEYVRELIRRDRDRSKLRGLLLEGVESAPGAAADAAYFDSLRRRARRRVRK
jgi:antitoxin ParD1/3/4